ncbi:hypothetical protein [Enterobacter hormaechei]
MSNVKNLIAACINCYEENDVFTIGIGDDRHDPKNFIIIGRFDEDELPVNECIGFQSESTEYELTDSIRSLHHRIQLSQCRLLQQNPDACQHNVTTSTR